MGCAKYDTDGKGIVAPVDRSAVSPEVIIWTASELYPSRKNTTSQ